MDVRILKHESNYLIAELLAEGSQSSGRSAVISTVEFEWLRLVCPHLPPVGTWTPVAQRSVCRYLDELFPQ